MCLNDSTCNDLVVYHCILKTGEVTWYIYGIYKYVHVLMCLNCVVPATFLLPYSLKHYQKGANYGWQFFCNCFSFALHFQSSHGHCSESDICGFCNPRRWGRETPPSLVALVSLSVFRGWTKGRGVDGRAAEAEIEVCCCTVSVVFTTLSIVFVHPQTNSIIAGVLELQPVISDSAGWTHGGLQGVPGLHHWRQLQAVWGKSGEKESVKIMRCHDS